jgi:hypothetical protein
LMSTRIKQPETALRPVIASPPEVVPPEGVGSAMPPEG